MSVEPRDSAGPSGRGMRPAPQDFRIGDRLVRPGLNRIVTPEATLQLEPKVMQVLVRLADRPGEVVTKEQLFHDVWDGAFVTEDVLTRAVGELRRAFADDAARPRVIETIRKSGYRLIAPVAQAPPSSPAPLAAAASSPALRLPGAGIALAAGLTLAAVLTLGIFALSRGRRAPAGPMRVRPITALPGSQRDPAVSPDGTRVAFASNGGSATTTASTSSSWTETRPCA